jgi:hypothetical protein
MRRAGIAGWALTASLGVLSMLVAHCGGFHVAHVFAERAAESGAVHAHGAHAHVPHHVEHGNLLPVASGAFIGVVLAGLAVAIVMRRQSRRPSVSLSALFVVQAVGFVAVTFVDRVVHDVPLTDVLRPGGLVAVALQVPVGVVVCFLCRRAVAAVARFLGRAESVSATRGAAPVAAPCTVHRPVTLHWTLAAGRRGPPRERLVHA